MTTELEKAMALVRETERTDPEAIARIEMARVVADVPFYADSRLLQRGPSPGGLDPRNHNQIAAMERSHAAMIERDLLARERQAASQAKAAETLAAGQSPENAANIRQSVKVGT